MTYVLRLGFKNVFRQRLRAGLAILGIALSVALVIVGTSLMSGIERTIFRDALGEAGEIIVARQEYFERSRFNPLRYFVRGSGDLRERLLAETGVRAAIERIDFGFLAEHDGRSTTLACSAVDVEQFARFSQLPRRLVAGRYLEADEKAILIGRDVAEELGVGPGDSVTIVGRTVHESFTADDFAVAGIFDLGSRVQNRRSLMPLAAAQEFLVMPDAVSRLLVYAEDYLEVDTIAQRIREAQILGEGVAMRTWKQDTFFGGLHVLFDALGIGITGIMCFVAGLGIFNMMTMTVMERRRELGVLMALGTPRSGILASILCEAIVYGLAGGAVGVVLGSPMAIYLDRVGIALHADRVQGIPFPIASTLHGHFGPENVVLGLAMGVLLTLLGTFIPVLRTSSMGPQDAMARR